MRLPGNGSLSEHRLLYALLRQERQPYCFAKPANGSLQPIKHPHHTQSPHMRKNTIKCSSRSSYINAVTCCTWLLANMHVCACQVAHCLRGLHSLTAHGCPNLALTAFSSLISLTFLDLSNSRQLDSTAGVGLLCKACDRTVHT